MCMEMGRGKKEGASLSWDAAKAVTGNSAADELLKPFARGKYDLRRARAPAGYDYDKLIKPLV